MFLPSILQQSSCIDDKERYKASVSGKTVSTTLFSDFYSYRFDPARQWKHDCNENGVYGRNVEAEDGSQTVIMPALFPSWPFTDYVASALEEVHLCLGGGGRGEPLDSILALLREWRWCVPSACFHVHMT